MGKKKHHCLSLVAFLPLQFNPWLYSHSKQLDNIPESLGYYLMPEWNLYKTKICSKGLKGSQLGAFCP